MRQKDGWLFVPLICHVIPRILPQSKESEELVCYCETENLVIGCDSNARHTAWVSTNYNDRGEPLVEFLNSSNLEILNQGNESTFCSGYRQEVIYITLGSFGFLESISGWEVSLEPSLSVHRHTVFNFNLMTVRQGATYSVYYISVGSSMCFGCWHPSSGARTTVITASGID